MALNSFRRNPLRLILLLSSSLLYLSCQAQKITTTHNSDATQEIRLGNQGWMQNNLNVKTFRNGDPIPEVKSAEEWRKAAKENSPAWCYYQNDSSTAEEFGLMYNWYAVNDLRGLAPAGWRVPTSQDWIELEEHFGISVAGTRMKCDSMTTKNLCVPLGGYRTADGNFTGIGEFTYLSGATEDEIPETKHKFFWGRGLHVNNATVMRCGLEKEFGLYVRCLRN